MRIGIDISQIVFSGTGVAMYTRMLIDELLKIDHQNDYILYGSSLRQSGQFRSFAKNKKVTSSFWSIPPTLNTILHNDLHTVPIETFTGQLNLFHASDWLSPKTQCPKVTTIHDLVVYRSPESTHPAIIATQKKTLALAKKECAHIIVDSQATKQDCMEILGIPEKMMSVIHLASGNNAVAFSQRSEVEKKEAARRALKTYQITKPYFFAVGTRQPRKNIDRLIEAFKLFPKDSCELVIAGNYGWGNEMSNEQLAMNNIKILGFVPEQELGGLYSGALAFVYPSLYEGFGIPILEAMTIGTPVITSNLSSMPEAGGKAAIYIDPFSASDLAEKMKFVLDLSSSKREKLIDLGKTHAKTFTWEKTANETLKIYRAFSS